MLVVGWRGRSRVLPSPSNGIDRCAIPPLKVSPGLTLRRMYYILLLALLAEHNHLVFLFRMLRARPISAECERGLPEKPGRKKKQGICFFPRRGRQLYIAPNSRGGRGAEIGEAARFHCGRDMGRNSKICACMAHQVRRLGKILLTTQGPDAIDPFVACVVCGVVVVVVVHLWAPVPGSVCEGVAAHEGANCFTSFVVINYYRLRPPWTR